MPNTLFSTQSFSMANGIYETGAGVRKLTSLLVGLPEYKRTNKDDWIEASIQPYRLAHLIQHIKQHGDEDPRLLATKHDREALLSRLETIQQKADNEWLSRVASFQESIWVAGKQAKMEENILTQKSSRI